MDKNWLASGVALGRVALDKVTAPVRLTLAQQRKQRYWKAFREAESYIARGSRPRGSTVRRMMRLIKQGGPVDKGAVVKIGDRLIHPTKGFRSA